MKKIAPSSSGKGVAASALSQRSGKLAPSSGQASRTTALREARTARVKAALAKAGSSSPLFKTK